jgi:hypothetical protein
MNNSTSPQRSNAPSPRRRVAVVAGIAGLAVAGVVGLTACGSSNNSSSTPAAASSTANQPPSGKHHHGNGVFGTIASINGNTWTVTKRDGSTETVTITSSTQFGGKNHPEQQSQFAVGDHVAVRGQVSGNTVTATRIMKGPNHAPDGATPPPSGAPEAPPSPAPTN